MWKSSTIWIGFKKYLTMINSFHFSIFITWKNVNNIRFACYYLLTKFNNCLRNNETIFSIYFSSLYHFILESIMVQCTVFRILKILNCRWQTFIWDNFAIAPYIYNGILWKVFIQNCSKFSAILNKYTFHLTNCSKFWNAKYKQFLLVLLPLLKSWPIRTKMLIWTIIAFESWNKIFFRSQILFDNHLIKIIQSTPL